MFYVNGGVVALEEAVATIIYYNILIIFFPNLVIEYILFFLSSGLRHFNRLF